MYLIGSGAALELNLPIAKLVIGTRARARDTAACVPCSTASPSQDREPCLGARGNVL